MVGCNGLQPQLLILYAWGGAVGMFSLYTFTRDLHDLPAVGMFYLPKQKTQGQGGDSMDTKLPEAGMWVWGQMQWAEVEVCSLLVMET